MCMCFLAQKIHISENAKEALEQIGSYHIVFRGSMEVKVNCHLSFLETFSLEGYCGENCAQTNKWIHTPMYWYKGGEGR